MSLPQVSQQIGLRLAELYRRHLPTADQDVSTYYVSGRGYQPPAARDSQRDRFGICLALVDGTVYHAGDWDVPFALQSISKVFAYGLALADNGRERLLRRVGVEPSGNAFNSLVFDEHNKRPFNPMVNAGALVTTDLIHGDGPEHKLARILDALRCCAGNDELTVDPVTCRQALPRDRVRDVLAVMYTCGMYDFAGEWAYSVGVPAKSGVSGGVIAVIPGKMGVGVFSPGLDRFGNSVRGTRVCHELSERLGLHMFATDAEDGLLNPAATPAPAPLAQAVAKAPRVALGRTPRKCRRHIP